MYKINTNSKSARVGLLILILIGVLFFMLAIKGSYLSFNSIVLSFIFSVCGFAIFKFYFFDYDILVGDNKIVIESFFSNYSFKNGTSYTVKHFGILSLMYSVYKIVIGNKEFWFIYRKSSFFELNARDKICKKIDENIGKGIKHGI